MRSPQGPSHLLIVHDELKPVFCRAPFSVLGFCSLKDHQVALAGASELVHLSSSLSSTADRDRHQKAAPQSSHAAVTKNQWVHIV